MEHVLKKKKSIIVSAVVFIVFFCVMQAVGTIDTNYDIVFQFQDEAAQRDAQLYYNTGEGFNSDDCVTDTLSDGFAVFKIKYAARNMFNLRIDPINKSEALVIEQVYFKWMGIKFDQLSGEEFVDRIFISSNCSIEGSDGNLYLYPENDDPYLILTDEYTETCKLFFVKVRLVMMVINVLLSICLVAAINVLYYFINSKHNVFKNLLDITVSCTAVFYMAGCLIHRYHNQKFSTFAAIFLLVSSTVLWFAVNKIKKPGFVNKMKDKLRLGLIPAVFALDALLMWTALINGHSWIYIVLHFLPVVITAVLADKYDFTTKNQADKNSADTSAFTYILLISVFIWLTGIMGGERASTISLLFGADGGGQAIVNIMITVLSWVMIFEYIAMVLRKNKADGVVTTVRRFNKYLIIFTVLLMIYELMNYYYGFGFSGKAIFDEILNYFRRPVNVLNVFLIALIYLVIYTISSRGMANLICGVVYLFLLIGNFVKLVYHDTYFTIADVFQLADFFRIAKTYVTTLRVIAVVIGIIAIVSIIFAFRKRIKASFKFKIRPYTFAPLLVLCIVSFSDIKNYAFADVTINIGINWLTEKENAQWRGIVVYNYFNILKYKEIFPDKPEGYTEETVQQYVEEFSELADYEVSDVQPDVIVVMMESQFELDTLDAVDISVELDPYTKEYKAATLISPRYGGGTAAVEFEALTGLSVSFFPGDIIPYTTFFNSTNKPLPSIAQEFSDSGYTTVAVHPNTASFYNRNIVYECMGFDTFLAEESFDFSRENCTADGFMKNDQLADVIIEQMESAEDPLFLFSVSIEGHREYISKYLETEVNVTDGELSDSELNELEQYAQTVIEDDKFIQTLIEYVDNREEPTIIYFFGDHLPKLDAFDTLGFIDDNYNKYSTPIVAYSNYKTIEIDEEYISPNQLAPQILLDAEIEHSSYFDYIYSLRESYPVITKAFTTIDENLDLYQFLQYDVLYGNRWFYELDKN